MQNEQTVKSEPKRRGRLSKRTLVSMVLILAVIPLTIYAGLLIGDRQYYLISLLIILYTIIPFFMVFEKRKPKARELVVIAVLCAIAVAGRAVFIFLPFFKPLVAIVIITGIVFGGEAGFLCGAVSGFVSNFIFGQGPWTPWQMFAYGIAGFIAGVLYQKGVLKKEKLPLSIFGAGVVMIVVGPLLDLCTLFTMTSMVNTENAAAVFIAGLPVNAIHAVATVVFLLLLSGPMFEKLDRLKLKYKMMQD